MIIRVPEIHSLRMIIFIIFVYNAVGRFFSNVWTEIRESASHLLCFVLSASQRRVSASMFIQWNYECLLSHASRFKRFRKFQYFPFFSYLYDLLISAIYICFIRVLRVGGNSVGGLPPVVSFWVATWAASWWNRSRKLFKEAIWDLTRSGYSSFREPFVSYVSTLIFSLRLRSVDFFKKWIVHNHLIKCIPLWTS